MKTGKGCLMITIAASIVPVIVGMLMFIVSRTADQKALGLATAVICPAVIWAVYGCAFFPFKGFFSS